MPVEGITYRLVKASPLTPAEGDENWRALEQFSNGLEALLAVSLNPDGSLKSPPTVYGPSVTGTDAYAITPSPVVATMASLVGRAVVFLADTFNTGPATLNVSGLGAFPIRKFGSVALETKDVQAGQVVTLAWDSANQWFQMQSFPGVVQPTNYGVDTGVANAYVVAQSGIISAPAVLTAGFNIRVKIANNNTTASTLAVGSSGPIAIKKNGNQPVAADDLASGNIYDFTFDGTYFQVVNSRQAVTPIVAQGLPAASGVLIFPHTLVGVPSPLRYCAVFVCTAAQYGYQIGDEVPVSSTYYQEVSNQTVLNAVSADSVNVYIAFFTQPLMILRRDTPTVAGAMTRGLGGSWSAKIYVQQ